MSVSWKKAAQSINLCPGYDTFRDAGDCIFDVDAANRLIKFFGTHLSHVKGKWAGHPLKLEPWQKAWLCNLVGWKRPNGTRRYRECFTYVPRKNGKSLGTAGLGLFLLLCDGEPGAEIYCAAAEKEQASLVFGMADGMIIKDQKLTEICRTYTATKEIKAGTGLMKALSAEAYSKHGLNAHGIIIDELHAQPDAELVDVLLTSRGSREQPIVQYITTADYLRQSVCNDKYDYACKVRDGIIKDPYFLPIVYETLPDEDWKDPEIWKKANPNYGVSINTEFMDEQFQKAINEPTFENTFKRLYLNLRTEQDVRFIPVDKWNKCAVEYTELQMHGALAFGGFDGASTSDICAYALYFPQFKRALHWYWCPEEMVTKKLKSKIPYDIWSKSGFIKLTKGDVADYDLIREDVRTINRKFRVKKMGVDPKETTQLQTQWTSDGFDVVRFIQNHSTLNSPTKELEKLVTGREFGHNNNPVTNWMISNASVEFDTSGTLVKISKKTSVGKIDGVVALIMALGVSMADIKPHPYGDRGFIVL